MSSWEKLVAVNVGEHLEKKGQFSYLSWAWAWRTVKDEYPSANFELLEDLVYPDSTMEVRVTVTIEDMPHTCWLPVLDFKNKPITNPNAFDINTARMRCLVKALALHGLGLYVYSGEDLPAPSAHLVELYEEMLGLVAQNKHWELRKFVDDNQPRMDDLFNMAPQGKKTQYKADVRACYKESADALKQNLAILEEAVGDPNSSYSVTEILNDPEMSPLEREYTINGCNEVLLRQVTEELEKA